MCSDGTRPKATLLPELKCWLGFLLVYDYDDEEEDEDEDKNDGYKSWDDVKMCWPNPHLCSKKGGGHKNVRVSKTLRCVSQRKLTRKQNTGISTRKLALWPRKWCVSAGVLVSNSLQPCEMKDLF